MLEKEIEAKLKRRIESLKNGVKCLKFVSPGYTGVPDRMILLPGGRVVFVELKQPGRRERKRQEYVQGKMRELGFDVFSSVRTDEQIEQVWQRCREVLEDEGIYTA